MYLRLLKPGSPRACTSVRSAVVKWQRIGRTVAVASEGAKGGCGTSGATVTFALGGEGDPAGTEADQSGTWDDSQVNDLDITFTTE